MRLSITSPILRVLLFFIGALFAFWTSPHMAHAVGQNVCNETSYVIYLATAIPENDKVRTEGWVRLRPGQCRVVLPAPFTDAPYYAYGKSSEVHAGGRQQWGGRKPLCVDQSGNFSLTEQEDCASLGLQTRHFNLINVSPPEGGKTVLFEPNDYGARAELAGIQRLLKDNGYKIRSIDGYDGRGTRSSTRAFLTDHKISPKPEGAALIDLLENNARKTLAATGLTICNRTPSSVWTAYGRYKDKKWESRGWWNIKPDACTQVMSGLFKDKEVFLYAALEQGADKLHLLGSNVKFCTREILFSITDKGKCEERGYNEHAFARYPNDSGKGLTVELTMEDFTEIDILARLRR